MKLGVISTTLGFVRKVINYIPTILDNTRSVSTKSLADSTTLTRVEPLTIVSKDLMNLDYMPEVAQSTLSIFAGYYLQAVSILTQIRDIEVVRILDKLNPNRDSTGFVHELEHQARSLEAQKISLEMIHLGGHLSQESYRYALPMKMERPFEYRIAQEASSNDNIKVITELSNLSVGKLLNLQLDYSPGQPLLIVDKSNDVKLRKLETGYKEDNKDRPELKATLPVSIRLMASTIPNNSITHLLAYKTEDNSLVERFHRWRSGRIEFFRDLIFCQDLIDEYKRAMIKDDTGTLQEIVRRVNNAKKFGLMTQNPSLVSASSIFIISEEVAREVESKLGGRLNNPNIRKKAFENTYAMMIIVVDREAERVVFHTRNIASSLDVSIREIKSSNKGKGPDIADIMKSLSTGQMPSF